MFRDLLFPANALQTLFVELSLGVQLSRILEPVFIESQDEHQHSEGSHERGGQTTHIFEHIQSTVDISAVQYHIKGDLVSDF